MGIRNNKATLNRGAGLTLVVISLILVFGIHASRGAPKNARVIVDNDTGIYIAPPCVAAPKDWTHYSTMTLGHAEKLNMRADPVCVEHRVFQQEGRSLGGFLLEKVGLLKPLPSRWNDDGTWKW